MRSIKKNQKEKIKEVMKQKREKEKQATSNQPVEDTEEDLWWSYEFQKEKGIVP